MVDTHLHARQQCYTPSSQDLGGQADGWGQVYHLTHALTLKTLSARLPAAGYNLHTAHSMGPEPLDGGNCSVQLLCVGAKPWTKHAFYPLLQTPNLFSFLSFLNFT